MNKFAEALIPGDTYKGYPVLSNHAAEYRGAKVRCITVDYGKGALPRYDTFYPAALERCPQV